MASDDLVRIVYRSKRIDANPAAGTRSAKATPRRNRTSISMDPDLYQTFCLIEGDVRMARSKLRQWATEADGERQSSAEATGVSRLVHKRMLAKIREVVEAGLTVLHNKIDPASGHPKAAKATGADAGDELGAAWDSFQGGRPGNGARTEAKKAIKKAATAAKKGPGRKGVKAGSPAGETDDATAEVTTSGAADSAETPTAAAATGSDARHAAGEAEVTGFGVEASGGAAGVAGAGAGTDFAADDDQAGASVYTRERIFEDGADPFMG